MVGILHRSIRGVVRGRGACRSPWLCTARSFHDDKSRHSPADIAQARHHFGEAVVYRHLEDALRCYTQDLEVAQQMDDHAGEVLALTRIGSAIDALAQEDHNAHGALHSENLSQAECDELKGMVRATESLGHRETSSGNFEEAVGYHCQSLQMAQQIGDANKYARAVENAGCAIDSLARSLEDTTEQHPRRQSIGCAIEAAGHLEDALRCYTQDLEFAQQMDDYAGEVLALTRIGSAIDELAQEDHIAHTMPYSENLSEAECDELKGMVRATESLGHRETSSGNFEEAVGYHCQSLQMAQQIGDANKCARAVENAGCAIDSLAR